MSFTIFIIVVKNVYPFWIKYFKIKNTTNDIAILSQVILSTSIDFLIKLIIKKRIKMLNATGTIQSFTVLPMDQIFIFWTLEKLVKLCIEPIKFALSNSMPKTLNLKL